MIRGSYVALITPFHADGSVDLERLAELCQWHIQNGSDGIVVLGTTGESSTMTHEEDEAVVRRALETVKGRVPVIAGSGSNSTDTALMKSKAYEALGVDGLLLITPYYNKANDRGMIRHFETVADQVNVPIILYNVPSRTSCNLSVPCVKHLSKHKNIVALKEASGNISYVAQVARYIDDNFSILSGNDDMIVPVLSLGGVGVISVLANIAPRIAHDIVAEYLSGNHARARELQLTYLDLINALFIEVNPIPVKEAMNMLHMRVGGFRLPLAEMDDGNREKLRKELSILGSAE
jgi:4-hydroxy-tetrahydrodipicolinate synthase